MLAAITSFAVCFWLLVARCGLIGDCGCGVHDCFLLGLSYWPLPLNRAAACDIHAERLLAKAGGSKCKLRGIPTLGT